MRLRQQPSFEAGTPSLSWADLVPSSEEKADAQRTKDPVMVSVWNDALTTLPQARALYGRQNGIGFRLAVSTIGRESEGRCDVLADPIDGEGGAGHCGVTGLDKRSGEPKTQRQDLLQRIADTATLIEE